MSKRTLPAKLSSNIPKGVDRLRRASLREGEVETNREGGDFGAGMIEGVAVITRGEALGHRAWVDSYAVNQVVEFGKASPAGIKSRFAHPGLSSDGIGRALGRLKNFRGDGEVARADLHFFETAKNTPEGDLASYVMDLVDEDPGAAGLSIVFEHDEGEEDRFYVGNEDKEGRFVSPDADNKQNYYHIRLAELRGGDVVDEPAANPTGMFHRQVESSRAFHFLDFVFDVEDEPPSEMFGVHPERARAFFHRWLELRKEIVLSKTKQFAGGAVADDVSPEQEEQETEPKEQPPAENTGSEDSPAVEPESDTEPKADSEEEPKLSVADVTQFTSMFGPEKGLEYLTSGKSWTEALESHCKLQKAEIESLQKRIKSAQLGQENPVPLKGQSGEPKKPMFRPLK